MRLLILLPLFTSACLSVYSQQESYKQPMTFGIHFLFNDFNTAAAIRATSLSSVLKDRRFGKLRDMSQGLALSFGKGVSETWDFYSTVAGSFLSYPIDDKPASGSESLLVEVDASIRGKLLSDKYIFVPYVQIGAGFSKYQGYWGAFIPAGVGIQVNFFDEAYLQINSQYRMGITEHTSYHFVHSIGLVGNIGVRN